MRQGERGDRIAVANMDARTAPTMKTFPPPVVGRRYDLYAKGLATTGQSRWEVTLSPIAPSRFRPMPEPWR
jgi:hypothetical protein